jgi:hypothetical protein
MVIQWCYSGVTVVFQWCYLPVLLEALCDESGNLSDDGGVHSADL